ncbi:hypothetical protein As57867_016373, partial [Aphanomyces stellatus]
IHIRDLTPETRGWLVAAEPVHRELRPQLPADYAHEIEQLLADRGELLLAVDSANAVAGVGLFHVARNTVNGRLLHVDDLVVAAAVRSKGVGREMLMWLRLEASRRDAAGLVLSSETQRANAHRFFCREGFLLRSLEMHLPLRDT